MPARTPFSTVLMIFTEMPACHEFRLRRYAAAISTPLMPSLLPYASAAPALPGMLQPRFDYYRASIISLPCYLILSRYAPLPTMPLPLDAIDVAAAISERATEGSQQRRRAPL